jgi:enamine deaminase RidA (YjgF/YER057c/UK114 family)
VTPQSGCSIVVRRFSGPQADEFTVLCRPEPGSGDVARQTATVCRAFASALDGQGASWRDVVAETLFLRDARRDLPPLLAARDRALDELGQRDAAPRPAFIQQPPLEHAAAFALAARVVVARDRRAWEVRDVPFAPACACTGCARSGARVTRLGDRTSVHTTNVYGQGVDAYEQAWNAFVAAERLLAGCGTGFADVVRTWIHLRDIDRDYAALNRARRAFFAERGVVRRPASTGVQGGPFPDGHDVAVTVCAVRDDHRPLDATPISTPTLNEAWSYGADFSRGLRLVDGNAVRLHVSGTASIDEAGRTVHVADLAGQADRMLRNVRSLLLGQGATFGDVTSAVVYVKHPADAAPVRARLRDAGFDGFPCLLVEAPLCRPELLCELEAVALLPVEGGA